MSNWGKPKPADIVVDIETVVFPVTKKEREKALGYLGTLEAWLAEYKAPKNIKDIEKLANHKAEFLKSISQEWEIARRGIDVEILEGKINKVTGERKGGKRFSFSGKKMVCVGIGEALSARGQNRIQSLCSDNTKELCEFLATFLAEYQEYNLIGYNHEKFDLPEIAKQLYLNDVQLKTKPGKWGIIDLSRKVGGKLKENVVGIGLEPMDVNGSDVGFMYAEGNYKKIEEYCADDVHKTCELFKCLGTILSF